MLSFLSKQYNALQVNILKKIGVPKHIAFIMDGNSRWSRLNHLPRAEGHKSGFSALLNIMELCYDLGIKYMTVYAFSADNFSRSVEEVSALMDLAIVAIDRLTVEECVIHFSSFLFICCIYRDYIHRNQIQVNFFGDLDLLSERAPDKQQGLTIRKRAAELMYNTQHYKRLFPFCVLKITHLLLLQFCLECVFCLLI